MNSLHRPTRLALALAFGLAGVATTASASLVYGTLSNFDVYNDTGGRTYGFEIEFDDISPAHLGYTFGNPHYGPGLKSIVGTTTKLRYAATHNGNDWSAFTEQHLPGSPVATSGHACVFAEGCEHFGVGVYGNPSATRYHWLVEDPLAAGTLMQGPAVDLMAPIWVVSAPADPQNAPNVDVIVQAPEFEVEDEAEKQYPDAVWAKIIKIELENPLALEDLMSDNDDLFNNPNINVEVETEWELVEKGANPLERGGRAGDGVKQIVRRVETYHYIGPVTDENEPDCAAIDCDNPILGETLGDLIGANIAALNLEPVEFAPPAAVPLPPAAWLFGTAAVGLLARTRRRRMS